MKRPRVLSSASSALPRQPIGSSNQDLTGLSPDCRQRRCVDLEPLSARSADTALHTIRTTPELKHRRRASRLPPGYHSIVGAAVLVGRAPSCLYDEVRRG